MQHFFLKKITKRSIFFIFCWFLGVLFNFRETMPIIKNLFIIFAIENNLQTMNKFEIFTIHGQAVSHVINKRIFNAIDLIKQLAEQSGISAANNDITIAEQSYRLMLDYNMHGAADPNRAAILCQLQISLLMMADSYKNRFLRKYTSSPVYSGRPVCPDTKPDKTNLPQWFTFILQDENASGDLCNTLESFITDDKITWYSKSLIVSAMTMSLLLFFDIAKVQLLYKFYANNQEQVWQRALVGLFVVFYVYNSRITLYKEVKDILAKLKADKKFTERYETIIIQFIRSINTDKITKKIKDEIIPEVTKMMPGIRDKMKADSLSNDDKGFEDKNPDWGDYFANNHNLLNKLEEISKLQLEGSDVFLNSFAMLKSFDFFKPLVNWFVPFYRNNSAVTGLSTNDDKFKMKPFAAGLEKAPFMCNSDKYSLCLSVSSMPQDQLNLMGKYFFAEVDQMNEISQEDMLLRKPEYSYKAITQYIQDLYRFFKINEAGKDFPEVFEKEFYPAETVMYDAAFPNAGEMRKVAEFFFANENYSQATGIFHKISQEAPDFEVFQKLGYAAQKSGDVATALDNYLHAQLFNDSQLWNLKKIGWCYRRLKQPDKALEFYQKAEALDPDNLSIATAIGRCHLELDNYEDALKYYFKVEYLEPKNTKVLRPICWCCYMSGRYEQAEKYIAKLLNSNPEAEDFVLAGNVMRSLKKLDKALDYYIKAFSFNSFDMKNLEDSLKTDYRASEGEDVSGDNYLIMDYIYYKLKENN